MKWIIFIIVVVLFAIGGRNNYANKSIDDIKYAKPTKLAESFDFESELDSLPHIEIQNITYPLKERYEYHFNRYSLTVSIPIGYEAYTVKSIEKPRVIESNNIEDSCMSYTYDYKTCGGDIGFWTKHKNTIISDDLLCIDMSRDGKQKKCQGMAIAPIKSVFSGISLRDIDSRTVYRYDQKHISDTHSYFVDSDDNDHYLILSDDQSVVIFKADQSSHIANDVYLNIIRSVSIEP